MLKSKTPVEVHLKITRRVEGNPRSCQLIAERSCKQRERRELCAADVEGRGVGKSVTRRI